MLIVDLVKHTNVSLSDCQFYSNAEEMLSGKSVENIYDYAFL